MFSILMALGTAAAPAGVDGTAALACAPDKHTACMRPASQKVKYQVPVGKRCHPDPTRAVGCVERLPASAERQRETRPDSD